MSLKEIDEELDNLCSLDIDVAHDAFISSLLKIYRITKQDDIDLNADMNGIYQKSINLVIKMIKINDQVLYLFPREIIFRYGDVIKRYPRKKSSKTHAILPFIFQLELYCTMYNTILFIKN